jgi:hypothetical protein
MEFRRISNCKIKSFKIDIHLIKNDLNILSILNLFDFYFIIRA